MWFCLPPSDQRKGIKRIQKGHISTYYCNELRVLNIMAGHCSIWMYLAFLCFSYLRWPPAGCSQIGPRLAGVDWMMLEIGKQRHYEILMKTAQAREESLPRRTGDYIYMYRVTDWNLEPDFGNVPYPEKSTRFTRSDFKKSMIFLRFAKLYTVIRT